MSIAEKLTMIAENEQRVFDAGKKAEQRAFWEQFQKRTQWQYAFAYSNAWTDENYNPIYPIRIPSANTNMYYQADITNTKVPLDASDRTLNYTFRDSDIVTIPELIVNESTDLNQAFTGASKLRNITITGTLANDVTMNACPLTVESMKSIIKALKDISETASGAYTLTLSDARKTMLEEDTETVEYEGVSYTYFGLITRKGWNLA